MRLWPALTVLLLAGPAVTGLAGTVLPALGYLPAAGGSGLTLEPARALCATPGIWRASALSLSTGLVATFVSLTIVALLVAGWSGTRGFAILERVLSPLLAVPHAAVALGLAMLIAPSGWLVRLVSPWLTGWERPPDLLILNDDLGLAMTLGLIVKEVPFLVLMTLGARAQLPDMRALTASLGYGRVTGWFKTAFPLIYPQIRLPVFAVLAFSMSVVDVAIVLGPSTPPTLSVLITRWMSDPDLSHRTIAAAGALWQLVLTLIALGLWRLGERAVARWGRAWVAQGHRRVADGALGALGLGAAALAVAAVSGGMLALALWSVAGMWRFPAPWPGAVSLRAWGQVPVAGLLGQTAVVALIATVIALVLVIGTLASGRRVPRLLLYLPLILPQTAFLPGLQILLLRLGLDRGMAPVILAHLSFVLPYVMLSLSGPWRAWDPRYGMAAASLGASPARVLWRVRLPMLLAPILAAMAIGIAVSVGQYLPTLLMGGGRVATLTTEAIALASGGDRRVIGATALLQMAAALLPFMLALILPALIWRHRKGMRHV